MEYWSIGVDWSQSLEWQMLGTVLLPSTTEHNRIGKLDCSLDSRLAQVCTLIFFFESEPLLNIKHYSKISVLNMEQMYISELILKGL